MNPAALDRAKLLAFLHSRSTVGRTVIQAVYAGAAVRVERGDFDVQESTRYGGGITPLGLDSVAERSPALTGASNTPAGLLRHNPLLEKEA